MGQRKNSFNGTNRPIRIILADDHQIVRQGLRILLEAESDMEIIAEADNGRKVLKLAQDLLPDVIIMDLSMPELNGIEATRQILSGSPEVKVIALSMHSDSLFVLNMIKAGASGYLLKDCALEELVKAIRAVVDHKTYLSPGVSDIVIRDFVTGWQTTTCLGVFRLVAQRTGSAAAHGGRQEHQPNRRRSLCQRQDRGSPPQTGHDEIGDSQCRRTHQVRYPPGIDLSGSLSLPEDHRQAPHVRL